MTMQFESDATVQTELALQPEGGPVRLSLFQRVEAFISRLSTRNNFWHRVCSLIWLPFAWRSGIHMKQLGNPRFAAVLPFKRVNRNWYNAMAGAALLGNSEVAGGMFLFSECGSDYAVSGFGHFNAIHLAFNKIAFQLREVLNEYFTV